MKVSFSHNKSFTPAWRGNRDLPENERFTVTLHPMNSDDLFLLMDAIGPVEQGQNLGNDQVRNLVKNVGGLLPKYVQFQNLEDGDGPVNPETVATFPYFLDLAAELLMEIAGNSVPSDNAQGN
jgi:hypothetical protein